MNQVETILLTCAYCGSNLEPNEDNLKSGICKCKYCLSSVLIPKNQTRVDSWFNRAVELRRNGEFDKAVNVYEKILTEDSTDPEAHWGLALSKNGIEFVDDPQSGDKVPTCHRTKPQTILSDSEYIAALEFAEGAAKTVLQVEAQRIHEIQKKIIEVSSKEPPYDIFISYKELDNYGQRTSDSVFAQDIFNELSKKGYRVFFARKTLEGKLGREYEPIIYAALSTAKVMIVVGTKPEHFNAVWVRNEWRRFQLMGESSEKTIIPVYRDMHANQLPPELLPYIALDMEKIGFLQEVVDGIDRIVKVKEIPQAREAGNHNLHALVRRGEIELEDEEWTKAGELFDQALNLDAECGDAYLGLAMAEARIQTKERFSKLYIDPESTLDKNRNVNRAKRFAGPELQRWFAKLDEEQKSAMRNAEKKAAEYRERILPAKGLIAAFSYQSACVMLDGSVIGKGPSWFDLKGWEGIRTISIGENHAVGLRHNGTVIAVGNNESGQCNVGEWKDIIGIATGSNHTVGLKKDGTVIVIGSNEYGQCETDGWKHIVEIAAGKTHTLGLLADGSVIAAGSNLLGQCNVGDWSDIVQIAAGAFHSVGLRKDGTVVAAGNNGQDQCNTSDWSLVATIAASDGGTIAITGSGKVLVTGTISALERETRLWEDIVEVSGGMEHVIGVRADGAVVSCSRNNAKTSFPKELRLFRNLKSLSLEQREATEIMRQVRAEQNRLENEKTQISEKIELLVRSRTNLSIELNDCWGVFKAKRRNELLSGINEIDAELFKLRNQLDQLEVEAKKTVQASNITAKFANVTQILLFIIHSDPHCQVAMKSLTDAGLVYEMVITKENADLCKKYGVKQAPTLVITDGTNTEKYVGVESIKQYLSQ